jgi:hypothetical protein
MLLPKFLIGALLASALPYLSASSPASAQKTSVSEPTLRPAKERGNSVPADTAASGGMSKQKRISLCLESWDKQTHMSKREWRIACERSLKDYPDAFN